MKLFTVLTAISSMVVGLQGILAVPLAPGHGMFMDLESSAVGATYLTTLVVTRREPWIPCWDGNSQIECKIKRQAGMDSGKH